jgi:hypothetical protein
MLLEKNIIIVNAFNVHFCIAEPHNKITIASLGAGHLHLYLEEVRMRPLQAQDGIRVLLQAKVLSVLGAIRQTVHTMRTLDLHTSQSTYRALND